MPHLIAFISETIYGANCVKYALVHVDCYELCFNVARPDVGDFDGFYGGLLANFLVVRSLVGDFDVFHGVFISRFLSHYSQSFSRCWLSSG